MSALRGQLNRGILGLPRRSALITLSLIVAVLATNLLYEPLNHGTNRIFLRTPLDTALPVVPLFAVPYVSLIPFIGVSLLIWLFVRERVFRSAALSMIAVWLVSYAFYFFLQSYVDRPVVAGTDPFSALVRSVYAGDRPYNDFPSLHVALSTVIAIHWWHVDRRIGVPVAMWTALIVASTVLIRQHYLADVAAGLVLAAAAATAMLRLTRAVGQARTAPHQPCRTIARMAYDEALAGRIRSMVAGEAALTEKKMFGGLAFLIGGNMAVAASGQGGLMVRVDPASSDELVATTTARMVEMRGREMPGWLRLASEDLDAKAELSRWVRRGVEYARSLPAKP